MKIRSRILLDFAAGVLANFLMPDDDPGGIVVRILLGIAAALAGFVGTLLEFGTVSGFDLRSLSVAVLGTMILLCGY